MAARKASLMVYLLIVGLLPLYILSIERCLIDNASTTLYFVDLISDLAELKALTRVEPQPLARCRLESSFRL